jgi:hypothetical protein
MTDQERWIIIPRWDEFQHRDMARSTIPPWIKNLTRLLGDDDYLALSQSQRGILHGLWLLYAQHRRNLSEAQARHKLSTSAAEARRWRDNLEALNHAGFVEVSASRPARHLASDIASLEVEVEEERVLKNPKSAHARDRNHDPPRQNVQPRDPIEAIRTMIHNGAITNLVDLDAELTAAQINGHQAAELRALLEPIFKPEEAP